MNRENEELKKQLESAKHIIHQREASIQDQMPPKDQNRFNDEVLDKDKEIRRLTKELDHERNKAKKRYFDKEYGKHYYRKIGQLKEIEEQQEQQKQQTNYGWENGYITFKQTLENDQMKMVQTMKMNEQFNKKNINLQQEIQELNLTRIDEYKIDGVLSESHEHLFKKDWAPTAQMSQMELTKALTSIKIPNNDRFLNHHDLTPTPTSQSSNLFSITEYDQDITRSYQPSFGIQLFEPSISKSLDPLFTNNKFNDKFKCKSNGTKSCLAIKRLIGLLKYCSENHANEMSILYEESKDWIIDHYSHLVSEHNNDGDLSILRRMAEDIGLQCDIINCKTAQNHWGIPANHMLVSTMDNDLKYFQDLMDQIHCHTLHVHAVGLRVDADTTSNIYKDITEKKRFLKESFGTDMARFDYNRFMVKMQRELNNCKGKAK